MFNESFATAVERIGGAALAGRARRRRGARGVRALDSAAAPVPRAHDALSRQRLDALYRSDASDADKRAAQGRADARAARRLRALKASAGAALPATTAGSRAPTMPLRRAGGLQRAGAGASSACSSARAATSPASMHRGSAAPGRAATPLADRGRPRSDRHHQDKAAIRTDILLRPTSRDHPGTARPRARPGKAGGKHRLKTVGVEGRRREVSSTMAYWR